ncbi:MAG: hypothetical protein AB7F96_13245 [Beijerinckiaceae bacterium]
MTKQAEQATASADRPTRGLDFEGLLEPARAFAEPLNIVVDFDALLEHGRIMASSPNHWKVFDVGEGYVAGDMNFRIRGFWAKDAVWQEVGYNHPVSQVVSSSCKNDAGVPIGDYVSVDASEVPGRGIGDQLKMLINFRHLKDGAEYIVPSIVTIRVFDDISKVGIEPHEVSAAGILEPFKTIPGWEIQVSHRRLGGRHSCQSDGNLIKTGPQLVDKLSPDNGKVCWGALHSRFYKFVAGLGLSIKDDLNRVCLEKTSFDGAEVFEVGFCSN